MIYVIYLGACANGYEVGECGFREEVTLTSAADDLGGGFPFTPAAAAAAAAGSWVGELSYNCDSGAGSEGGVAFLCGAEPAAELVTVVVDVSSIDFPVTGYVPEDRSVPNCTSWMALPVMLTVSVESGLFVIPASVGEVDVSGIAAPQQVGAVGGPATIPAESALSVYGETLDFQMTMGDVILGVDSDPSENIVSTIVASTGTGAMRKIQ